LILWRRLLPLILVWRGSLLALVLTLIGRRTLVLILSLGHGDGGHCSDGDGRCSEKMTKLMRKFHIPNPFQPLREVSSVAVAASIPA
jgi:hypothetical protein